MTVIESALSLVIFLLGLAVGSFVNVVIIRGHKGESLGGRSHCAACGTTLSFRELVPIFSFLMQKTRCRHCKSNISWQYPLVELACGLFYVGGFWLVASSSLPQIQQLFASLWLTVAIPAVVVIAVSDFRFQIIPDGATLLLICLGILAIILRVVHAIAEAGGLWAQGAVTAAWDIGIALALAGVLGGLWFFSHGQWMGFGDVKLILATSLILGFPAAIAAFLFAFWSGGVAGALLLLAGGKQLRRRIPFGPFILLGSALAWFFSSPFFNQIGFGILWIN